MITSDGHALRDVVVTLSGSIRNQEDEVMLVRLVEISGMHNMYHI
jgi:hypothetical protein